MPITSAQISGMIGGQQAMFGNVATYAQQISPFGGGGMPTYSNPMLGAGYGPAGLPGAEFQNQAAGAVPGMMMGAATYGLPIAAGAGMMMGGPVGGMLDPFTGGLRGAGRTLGWQSGAGVGANLGRVASMGVRALPRAIGGAALGAMPALAIGAGVEYAAGQVAEGAQFQNQVSGFLQNTFRQTNPASRTGQGFTAGGQRQIGEMFQEMGFEDIMSTPQELLGITQRAAQMGVFRGVQDARQFKQRFTQMKDALKEIASTFNTTLSEALPFFQNARQQGFWTPQDITRHARQVRQVQANTGMSAAQAQSLTAIGAQMVRGIGGTGQQGAEMMARAQSLTGAALFGGTVTEQQLGNAGFGIGAEGTQNMGQMLAGMSARFARSRVGRWALASMMNEEGTGLDQGRLAEFTSGGMGVGRMGALARRNVSGQRAYQFVENEEELRGQLAAQGPEAALGMVRSLVGSRLEGTSSRDRLVTRRIIQRFMGGTTRQADMIAQLARELPRIMEVQAARTQQSLDVQETQRERLMGQTWEGVKRKIGHWWDRNVDEPLNRLGGEISHSAGRAWQRFTDRLFGTTGQRLGIGMARGATSAIAASMMPGGGSEQMAIAFGGQRLQRQTLTAALTGTATANEDVMRELGFTPAAGTGGGVMGAFARGGLSGLVSGVFGGARPAFTPGEVGQARNIMAARAGMVGAGEAEAAGYGGAPELLRARGDEGANQISRFLRSAQATMIRGRFGGSEEGNRAYRRYMVRQISAGAAGGEAAAALEGLDEQTAMTRVMALQGRARGAFAGLRMGEGGLGESMAAIKEKVVEQLDDAREGLVTTLRGGTGEGLAAFGAVPIWKMGGIEAAGEGGIAGVAATGKGLEEVERTNEGTRALKMFARADELEEENPDKAEELRRRARDELNDLVQSGSLSKPGMSTAIRMMRGDKATVKAIAQLGRKKQTKAQVLMMETRQRRNRRIQDRLGEAGSAELERFKEQNEKLAAPLEALMTKKMTPNEYREATRELGEQLLENPEDAASLRGILKRYGAEHTQIGLMAGRAGEMAATLKKYSVRQGASMRRKVSSVSRALSAYGIESGALSREQLRGLVTGEGGAQDKLREALEGRYDQGQIEEIIGMAGGGMEKGEMAKVLGAQLAASGARSLDVRSTRERTLEKEGGLKKGSIELTGREGSPQFMGEQLKVQTQLARRRVELLEKIYVKSGGEIKKTPP